MVSRRFPRASGSAQMVQACEIRQQFPEIVGKIIIFRKPKPSQDSIKSRQEKMNLNFSRGRYPKHPLTRALGHYMAGPLFKSRRRPCSGVIHPDCRVPAGFQARVGKALPSQLQPVQSNVCLLSSYLAFILMLAYPGRFTSIPLYPRQVNDCTSVSYTHLTLPTTRIV